MSDPSPPTSLRRSLLLAGGTGLLYACWAFYANASHGAYLAGRAALAQSLITFTLTLSMTLVLERIHPLASTPSRRVAAATVGGVGAACALSLTLHTLSGTPELLRTMLPPMSIGATYCLLSAIRLERRAQRGLTPARITR